MVAEEMDIKKPSSNERLAANRVRFFNEGKMDIVKRLDDIKARRTATKRFARQRNRSRKMALRQYLADQERERVRDPPSDNERPST